MLLRGDRERREHRHAVYERQLDRQREHFAVDVDEEPPDDHSQHGQDRADDYERRARADSGDDPGRDDRAEADRSHHEPPRDAEDSGQNVVGDDPLEQGEGGDVFDAVRGTDHGKQDHGCGEVGPGRRQRDRQAPEDESDAEGHCQPPSLEPECPESPEQPADPQCGGQVADRALAGIQQAEGADDDQHVQAAADEALGRDQTDDQPRLRRAGDDAKAGDQELARPGACVRRRHLNPTFDQHPLEQAGGDEQHHRGDEKDDAGFRDREQHSGHEGADEGAEALHGRGRSVGGDQLFGRPGKRGQERLERRPEERRGHPDDRGEHEDDRLASPQKESRGRATERRRPHERDRGEKPLAPEAISQRRGKGGEDRRGQHPDQACDADGGGAARGVREDPERHEVHPLGRDRGAPGELDPAQIAVAPEGREGRHGLRGLPHLPIPPREGRESQPDASP